MTTFYYTGGDSILSISNEYKNTRFPFLKKFFIFLRHPIVFFHLLDLVFNDSGLMRKRYVCELEKHCITHDYDIVIGVSGPAYIFRALADAKIKARKAIMMFDAYAYNQMVPRFQRCWRKYIERKSIEKIDLVFALWCIYDDLKKVSPEKNIIPFDIPCVPAGLFSPEQVTKQEHSMINFKYLGNLYKDIRNPTFMLEMFRILPENYILNLYGGGCENLIKSHKAQLGEKLVSHGWVDHQTADSEMQSADILVNLNNTTKNQFPSKLLSYISTGKPIINICKLPDCNSLRYTKKYSNCLNIFETEALDKKLTRKITDFVSEKLGVRIPPQLILDLYKENTAEYVANLIDNKIHINPIK